MSVPALKEVMSKVGPRTEKGGLRLKLVPALKEFTSKYKSRVLALGNLLIEVPE